MVTFTTDPVAVYGATNPDKALIDDLHTETRQKLNDVEAAADTRLDTAESEIDALQASETTQDATLADHATRITTAEGEIDALQTSEATQDGNISTLQTEMDAVELRADVLEGDAVTTTASVGVFAVGFSFTDTATGDDVIMGGVDRDGYLHDIGGSLRDTITEVTIGIQQVSQQGLILARADDTGKIYDGWKEDGTRYFFAIDSPTLDALSDRIDNIEVAPSTTGGQSETASTIIANDVHSRPQVFGVTATWYEQLTWSETGVSWQAPAPNNTASSGRAYYAEPAIGGQGNYAGWDADLVAASADGTIRYQPSYGQSLSLGLATDDADSDPETIVLTAPDPGGVLMFSDSAVTPNVAGPVTGKNDDDPLDTTLTANLTDAVEVNTRWETGTAARCTITRRFGLMKAAPVVGAAMGRGSQTITALSSGAGNNYYSKLIASVDEFVARAGGLSLSPVVDYISWDQGEADNSAEQAAYETAMTTLIGDLDTDIKASTSQTEDVRMTVSQMGHFYGWNTIIQVSRVALAQLARGIDPASNWCCIGPKYHMDFSDSLHLESRSYLELQVRHGLAHAEWERTGVKPLPLHITSAPTRLGAVITCTFNANGALAYKTTDRVVARSAWGFHCRKVSDNTLLSITDVQIVGANSDQVQLTLSEDPGGAVEVKVAVEGDGAQDTTTHRAANLVDSTDTPNPFSGDTLHRWASHQIIETDS